MHIPAISVIIPVYNLDSELAMCLESLQAQTFSDFEAIIVDDGSEDANASKKRTIDFDDFRFLWIGQEHAGLADARNNGISHAQGKYLLFLDADDILPQDSLFILYNTAVCKDVDVVCAKMSQHIPDAGAYTSAPKVLAYFQGKEVFQNLFSDGVSWNACGKLWKASLFDGVHFPSGRYFEDAFTVPLLIRKAQSMTLLGNVVYLYLQRPGSITHRQDADYLSDWSEAFLACEKLVQETMPELSAIAHERVIQSYLRSIDLILEWPSFRKNLQYRRYRALILNNLYAILKAESIRALRKLYALCVCATPDFVSCMLRLHRIKQQKEYVKFLVLQETKNEKKKSDFTEL